MTQTLLMIAVAELFESPTNPRKTFKQSSLEELAESLKQNGLLHPIVARPRAEGGYEVVTGARRTRAAKIAGLVDVPVTVRDYTDDEVLEIQIIENSQREDVDPLEEAYGYKALVDKGLYDTAGLASKFSKSIDTIQRRLALARIDPEVAAFMLENSAPLVALELVATLADVEDQREAADYWRKEGFTYRKYTYADFKQHVSREFLTELERATFDLEDPTLRPDMGPCTTCQFNTGSSLALFPDGDHGKCLKPSCFRSKGTITVDRHLQGARDRGLVLLSAGGGSDIPDVLPRHLWKESKAKDAEKGFIAAAWDRRELYREVTFKREEERERHVGSGYTQPTKEDKPQRRETLRLLKAEMIARRTVFDEVLRQYDGDPIEWCEAITTPEFWRAIAGNAILTGGRHNLAIYDTKDPVNGRHPGHDFRAEEFGLKDYWHSVKLSAANKWSDEFHLAVRTLFIASTFPEIHVGEGNNYQPFVLMAAVDALKIDLELILKEAEWSTLSKKAQRERLKAAEAKPEEESTTPKKGRAKAKEPEEPPADVDGAKPKRGRKPKEVKQDE